MQEQLSAAIEMVMLSKDEPEKKKKQEVPQKVGTSNGTTTSVDNSKDLQDESKTSPYDELIEEMKDNLSKGATAVQLERDDFVNSVVHCCSMCVYLAL